ncbi:unnamed protein product [Notodromas monacha]|uniref:Uncharacterized protein n=1 Tax=Notodromas monacha TaxID=399045 RepID=A0A7R9BWE8_9CRUS|nr:unnamed protein product [Notodromas monacha]CAG0921478.1 unnamed protein product [Notodromas monacha]
MTQTYVQEFWETYSEKPKLSFTLQGTYSHDDLNKLDMIDDELLEYLIWLNSPKMRNETMIVIMADHGPRGHALTMTRQGTIELRRPMMNIMMPPWFKTKFPKAWENLLVNSKRLVTTLDLHYTIKSLLSLQIMDLDTVPVLQNLPPGLTMFAPMPKGRTCAMAQVQSHYCACKNVKEVSTAPGSKHSDILHKLAKDVIVELNKRVQSWLLWCVKEMPAYSRFVKAMETKVDNKTGLLPNADSYHPFCREWSLEKIERAHLIVASKGNQTKLDDDELEESVSLQYELTIVARPGPGHFLATVWHNPVTNKSTVDVYYFSRMDWFSPHAKCIERVCPSLEKYCYC